MSRPRPRRRRSGACRHAAATPAAHTGRDHDRSTSHYRSWAAKTSWIAEVLAVDRAPLAPAVAKRANVTVRTTSAFGLSPDEVGPVDWWCSDLIAYPDRLLTLVTRWLNAGLVRNLVCTVKFQGATDHAAAARFAALPGAELCHLSQNKHELTCVILADT